VTAASGGLRERKEAQRSTDVSGAPSRVQMSGTARGQTKATPLCETVQIRPPQPKLRTEKDIISRK